MIFMHIVDDYYLQGVLASMKQKEWWEKNAPDEMYRYDYLCALTMHSFSWAFMIMLPSAFLMGFQVDTMWLMFLGINSCIHLFVDDLKANRKVINLCTDQTIHIIQILITSFCMYRWCLTFYM